MYKKQKNALTKYTPGEVQRHTQQKVNTQIERATLHSTKSIGKIGKQGKHNDDTSKGYQTKYCTEQQERYKTNQYTPRHIHDSTIQKYGINPTFAHLRK